MAGKNALRRALRSSLQDDVIKIDIVHAISSRASASNVINALINFDAAPMSIKGCLFNGSLANLLTNLAASDRSGGALAHDNFCNAFSILCFEMCAQQQRESEINNAIDHFVDEKDSKLKSFSAWYYSWTESNARYAHKKGIMDVIGTYLSTVEENQDLFYIIKMIKYLIEYEENIPCIEYLVSRLGIIECLCKYLSEDSFTNTIEVLLLIISLYSSATNQDMKDQIASRTLYLPNIEFLKAHMEVSHYLYVKYSFFDIINSVEKGRLTKGNLGS